MQSYFPRRTFWAFASLPVIITGAELYAYFKLPADAMGAILGVLVLATLSKVAFGIVACLLTVRYWRRMSILEKFAGIIAALITISPLSYVKWRWILGL